MRYSASGLAVYLGGDLVGPDVGIVTSVAMAHVHYFGSLDGIARAKGAGKALPESGVAVLKSEAEHLRIAAVAEELGVEVVGYRTDLYGGTQVTGIEEAAALLRTLGSVCQGRSSTGEGELGEDRVVVGVRAAARLRIRRCRSVRRRGCGRS